MNESDVLNRLTPEQKKYLRMSIEAYKQALTDTKQLVLEIFDKSIDLYNQKLSEL